MSDPSIDATLRMLERIEQHAFFEASVVLRRRNEVPIDDPSALEFRELRDTDLGTGDFYVEGDPGGGWAFGPFICLGPLAGSVDVHALAPDGQLVIGRGYHRIAVISRAYETEGWCD